MEIKLEFFRYTFLGQFLLLTLVLFSAAYQAEARKGHPTELQFSFTQKEERSRWKPVTFSERKMTTYTYDTESASLCAFSESSASALGRTLKIDLEQTPVLHWEWKVLDRVSTDGPLSKENDDYSARVYVNFENPSSLSYWQKFKKSAFESYYGRSIPDQSLNFVWADQIQKGRILPSPYTERVRLVALRDEEASLDRWYREEVNLLSVYHEAYGVDEVPVIDSLAIMTDTDNTNGEARACYRNFEFTTRGDTT